MHVEPATQATDTPAVTAPVETGDGGIEIELTPDQLESPLEARNAVVETEQPQVPAEAPQVPQAQQPSQIPENIAQVPPRTQAFLSDEELAALPENAKARITGLYGESKEAKRQHAASIEYAQSLQVKNQQMEQQLADYQRQLLEAQQTAVGATQEQAINDFQAALDTNDGVATREALKKLVSTPAAQLIAEPAQPAVEPAQPAAQPAAPKPTPAIVAWGQRNGWYFADNPAYNPQKKALADKVDVELRRQGHNPATVEYTELLDSTLAYIEANPAPTAGAQYQTPAQAPQNLGAVAQPTAEVHNMGQQQQPPVVAQPSRQTPPNTKKVKLTPSQRQVAADLGISDAQYAAEVLRLGQG